MTIHPNGYGTQLVTLDRLRQIHEPKMHPEYARRLFAWLGAHPGIGIGGGFRTTPAPGGAPLAQSFHWTQQFRSGLFVYCAVDLVVIDPGKVHRAPTWAESADAPKWGLHTFIKLPVPEPWHMQCIEMRGWQSWVNAGRPDPPTFALPVDPPPDQGDDDDVLDRVIRPAFTGAPGWYPYLGLFDSGAVRQTVSNDMEPRVKYKPTEWEFPVSDEGQYRRLCTQFNIQLVDPMPL